MFWFGDRLELVVFLLVLQRWGCCGLADLQPTTMWRHPLHAHTVHLGMLNMF